MQSQSDESEKLKPYFFIPDINLKNTLLFGATHSLTLFKSTDCSVQGSPTTADEFCSILQQPSAKKKPPTTEYWHRIIDGLYLGKVPVKNASSSFNQAHDVINLIKSKNPTRPLKLVITFLDLFEYAGVGISSTPVTALDWAKLGVDHIHVIMSDFGGEAPAELVIKTLLIVNKVLKDGASVLMHCKAGVGRSATAVLTYLTLFGDGDDLMPSETIDTAYSFLKNKRKISINKDQLKKAVEFVKFYHTQNLTNFLSSSQCLGVSFTDLNLFLASEEAKDSIRHLASFKELAIYACRRLKFIGKSLRSQYIRELFQQIYYAKDATWYIEMMQGLGPLQALIDTGTAQKDELDNKLRLEITNLFKEQVTQVIASALSWEASELIEFTSHPHTENLNA